VARISQGVCTSEVGIPSKGSKDISVSSIAMNSQPRTGHGQVESDCLIKTKHSDGDNSC